MTDAPILSAAKCRVVVLISGSGSNLQALIDASQHNDAAYQIVGVISNKPDAYGLQRAQQAAIPTQNIDHKKYPNRNHYDQILIQSIDTYKPDLIALAGFMRILGKTFVNHYHGRLLNIHPSLLPAYRGLHTHQRVIEQHEKTHGATVHFVTEELDGGPLILQALIPVLCNDNADTLASRVLIQEHQIYPIAVQWFAQKKLSLCDGTIYLNNQPLHQPVIHQNTLTN